MSTAIRKTTDVNGIFHYVESINTPDYPTANWEINPDVSGVSGVSRNYWKYDGTNVVVEMSQGEKDAVEAALAAFALLNEEPIALVYNDTSTFASSEEKIITLANPLTDLVVHVLDPEYQELIGETLLSASGSGPVGWDPGNISTGENNLNNGNYSDLTYNNLLTGNTSGKILGIDMLTPTTINAMRRYDYNAAYYDTEWQFIGTNDVTAATYTVIFTQSQTGPNLTPNPFFKAFADQTFRYYGWRCVSSFNATYTITSELELLSGTLQTIKKELAVNTDYEVSILNSTQIAVTNVSAEQRELKVIIIGK